MIDSRRPFSFLRMEENVFSRNILTGSILRNLDFFRICRIILKSCFIFYQP